MKLFIENVNLYLNDRKIKKNYISLITGWSQSKVSRILSEANGIKDEDKELLAHALGKSVDFFLGSPDDMLQKPTVNSQYAYFAGDLSKEDRKASQALTDMIRFYDSIINLQI